ncbi:PLP-dependent cysteine synthase family protein [Candidatus Bathyarchaeota archaeon]|nr:PLP-dependent cysteine synthase family protein [Candidatus Bathyarchaeota archaeon]MBS7613405.1 PLP-dependent cysteine synthase family protein [Candidatus Bathyarchaeota archaeon]MBS7618226.1 PLP-dependent cysteine synthase family protein [Candidatus Bathyarchaeota archaeon]
MVVLRGHGVLEALRLLSADKVPVFQVDSSKVKVKSLQPGLRPITLEAVIKAGVEGPRLPYKSFDVQIEEEIPSIEVDLNELNVWKRVGGRRLRVYDSTMELLYEDWPTPLVKLRFFSSEDRSVWAKLEGANPYSNSVKDRIGWSMIMSALEEGKLGDILYEATSTNTGIAITAIANLLGRKTRLFIPKTIQKASDVFLKVLGADVVRVPVGLTVEAIEEVDAKSKSEGATHLNQFENDANFKVHLKYTAKEIDEQLESRGLKPDCIVGGLGTSGHMSAISIYFKSKYGGSVKIVGVQPAPNEVIPGIRRIETGMKWIHWVDFDQVIDVKRNEAIEGALTVARKEGLLIGLSAGAVFHAFTKIAEDGGVYVLVFPDTGYKYVEQFEEYFHSV